MRSSNKRYAFDLTRPLHRYVWQLGGWLGKLSLILDSLGVIGLGLSGAGLLTMAFAENDRILSLGLRAGVISLCAGVACFGLARIVDFIGKFRDGEDPRSLILKQRQQRSADFRPDMTSQSFVPEPPRPNVAPEQASASKTPNLRLVEPGANHTPPTVRTGTTNRP
jgi:hypothetical protein